MRASVIIVAGGSGSRMKKNINKVFININNIPIIIRTLKIFEENTLINDIILVAAKNEIEIHKELILKYNIKKVKDIVCGGKTRQESVYKGLLKSNKCDIVLIHDAARPFVTQKLINKGFKELENNKYASPGIKIKGTVKKVNKNYILETVDRNELVEIQTPQFFYYEDILNAHIKLNDSNKEYTDDNEIIENVGGRIKIFEGEYNNIKITTEEDLVVGLAIDMNFKS